MLRLNRGFQYLLNGKTRFKTALWLAFNFVVAFWIISALDKNIVSDVSDGFTSQINYIVRTPMLLWQPLEYIHSIRYLVAAPFILLNDIASWLDSILILTMLLPFVSLSFKSKWILILQGFIFHLPVIFSLRTCLGMCALGYLYLALFQKPSSIKFAVSAVLAQLGSGIVLMWLAASLLIPSQLRRKKAIFTLAILLNLASLTISVSNKLHFFESISEIEVIKTEPDSVAKHGAMTFWAAISGNTFFDSARNSRLGRFAIFGFLFLAVLTASYRAFILKRYDRSFFFLIGASSFLFEGIGPLSLIVPLGLYFTEDSQNFSIHATDKTTMKFNCSNPPRTNEI